MDSQSNKTSICDAWFYFSHFLPKITIMLRYHLLALLCAFVTDRKIRVSCSWNGKWWGSSWFVVPVEVSFIVQHWPPTKKFNSFIKATFNLTSYCSTVTEELLTTVPILKMEMISEDRTLSYINSPEKTSRDFVCGIQKDLEAFMHFIYSFSILEDDKLNLKFGGGGRQWITPLSHQQPILTTRCITALSCNISYYIQKYQISLVHLLTLLSMKLLSSHISQPSFDILKIKGLTLKEKFLCS